MILAKIMFAAVVLSAIICVAVWHKMYKDLLATILYIIYSGMLIGNLALIYIALDVW